MSRFAAAFRNSWPALIIIALAAVVQIFLITRPIEFLLINILPDDAFYYFEIARNIAAGVGSTFDGLTATNGYHPLWMLILVPIYKIFGTDVGALEPIRAALAFSALLNAATGYMVWSILGRFTKDTFARLAGFAFWALNPFLLYLTVNGLETSLSLFFIALLFLQTVRIEERVTTRQLVILGIIGGLCILARIDTAAYVAAIVLWMWLRSRSRESFMEALTAGVVVAAIVAPWLLWNVTNFNMLLTSSSGANTLVNHTLIYQDNGPGIYQTVKATFYTIHNQIHEIVVRTGAPGLSFMLGGAAVALLFAGAWRLPRRWRDVPVIYAWWCGFLLLFLLNVAVRWTGRPWYFVSFGILLALLAAVSFDAIRLRWPYGTAAKRLTALACCGLLGFSFFVWWHKELTNPAPQQSEMYATATWLNEHVPSARIGVFNAGIIGYFSHAEIVNLDGLVNNEAYEAMRNRQLFAYLNERDIEYIADFPIYITYRYKSFWGVADIMAHLEEVNTIFLGGHNRSRDGLHIYRVGSTGKRPLAGMFR